MDKNTKNCKVTICGMTYMLATDEPEKLVQAASVVDALMKELMHASHQTDQKILALLVAVRLAGKVAELEQYNMRQEKQHRVLATLIDREIAQNTAS
jgi:cell division protein ZapA (FtsZ GTPase activity inhibitor)